jgi:hypothetical protein
VAGALLLSTAWLLPSYLSAERYRRRLESGLEAVLHRPARFGSASFRLLPRPGFSVEHAVIQEDAAFGSEPFARIDRVECDLRWRSLWRRRLDFARLRLERPSFNIIRNARGEWNLEKLLAEVGVAGPNASPAAGVESPFDIETEDGRINFKLGDNKKPFAIVDLRARLNLDPGRDRIRFRLAGNPIRADLPHPPPGILEFEGEWRPGAATSGVVEAALRTRGALLYNWVPLATGMNPELYGVIDADARMHGSLRVIKVEGEASVAQLHRWDLLPPADPMPIRLRYRGEFDRNQKQALIESLEVSFRDSRLHLTGAVDNIPESPELDLVVALERSRLEDWHALSHRLWQYPATLRLAGRVDGLLSLQGPWRERRLGGFIGARDVQLVTPSGAFPVSELALRIDKGGARLAPVTLSIAPRIALTAEGTLYPAQAGRRGRNGSLPARYEVKVAAKSMGLRDAVRFARALGIPWVANLDAEGIGNATGVLTGSAWPPARPLVSVKGEIRAARLLVPGLTEPVNIPRARLHWAGDRVVFDPVTAVVGTSVFTGRVEREGAKANPWRFDLQANNLSIEQGAALFDALGHRPPLPLLERIPGLRALPARRTVASGLFTALKARGRFTTPLLTYRSLTLQDFQASVDLGGRIVQLNDVTFRAGGGHGEGEARLDLTQSPAGIAGEVTVAGLRLQALARRLPPELRNLRGLISGNARFETRGLSRSEMSANLTSTGTVRLEKVSLGDFDPLQALARHAHWGTLEPPHREATVRAADIRFDIRERKVSVVEQSLEVEGARCALSGSWEFNGPLDLEITADLRRISRGWMGASPDRPSDAHRATLHLSGRFEQIAVRPGGTAAQASRQGLQ